MSYGRYNSPMQEILVLFYSHRGSVRALAQHVARGIESVPGMSARLDATLAILSANPNEIAASAGKESFLEELVPNFQDQSHMVG